MHTKPDAGRDPKLTPKDAYIVMPPFVNMASHMDKFATLLDRHIQWHKSLGFSRHVLYMRAADILIFSEINAVKHWTKRHQLLLVLWELFSTPRLSTPYWDQVIYILDREELLPMTRSSLESPH